MSSSSRWSTTGAVFAKLDVPPNHVLASLQEYEEALLPDLKKFFPEDFNSYISALDHLYFCVKLTLNNAYYQVRDLEARAFYEVLQTSSSQTMSRICCTACSRR